MNVYLVIEEYSDIEGNDYHEKVVALFDDKTRAERAARIIKAWRINSYLKKDPRREREKLSSREAMISGTIF